MKKVLILGGSGFLGSNLINKLKKKNYKITSISQKKKIFEKNKNVNYFFLDTSKFKKLSNFLKKKKFDFVINCCGNIDHKNKQLTYSAHYLSVKNLIKILNKKKINLFIQLGSSLEYGNLKSPQAEVLKCRPISIYGRAKFLASSFIRKHYKNKYIILRPYQIYGPGQKNDRLIPFVINSCLKSKKFPCSAGGQLRDFLYVDDFVNLVLKIFNNFEKINTGIYNIGTKKPHKVKYVIETIQKITGKGQPQYGEIKMRKDEILKLFPKINKLTESIKWQPKTSLVVGLKKTITYYLRNNENFA